MIRLTKSAEPQVLTDNKDAWTQAYLTALAVGPVSNTVKFRYRHSEIKNQIVRETSEKCAYCESKIRHVTPGDVEHILPSSVFPNLIFEWENLTLACTECNRRKLDYHDVADPLIHPYSDNPEDHLVAIGPLVKARPADRKGQITENRLELNSPALFERRSERIESLHNLAHLYAEQTGVLKDLLADQLRQEAQNDKEYSFVVKAYLETCLGIKI
jgi:uncharacterized protein (TIGR02646 family)